MKLLVFAHRGEALAFFQNYEFTPVNFYFNGLFKSEKYYLLITGEGPKEASEKTVAVLSSFKMEIRQVINLGVAGSLNSRLKIKDTVWIRSSYAQAQNKMEFKSFTTDYHSKLDCVTSFQRVTLPEERKFLSSFADIVDRELWSILSACHLFKIEGLSLKVISDDFSSNDFCELVKKDAPLYSQLLFSGWQKYENEQSHNLNKTISSPLTNSDITSLKNLHQAFYFTTSQERKMESLSRSLELKNLMTKDEIYQFCEKLAFENVGLKSPKDLTKNLLTLLDEINDPIKVKIKSKIKMALLPLTDAGVIAQIDPELELDHVHISYTISTLKDQKKLILALEQFQLQNIKDIFNGKIEDDV